MKRILGNKGFTLIELLVSMVVVIAISTIVGVILVSALRGATKTNTIAVVNQNGNYALDQMVQSIRYAQGFNGVVDGNGNLITDCTVGPGVQYSGVQIVGQDNGVTTYTCTKVGNVFDNIASQSAVSVNLLDTSASGIKLNSCYFTCSQTTSIDIPTIGIYFSLQQKNSNSAFAENFPSPVIFQTSVSLRNR